MCISAGLATFAHCIFFILNSPSDAFFSFEIHQVFTKYSPCFSPCNSPCLTPHMLDVDSLDLFVEQMICLFSYLCRTCTHIYMHSPSCVLVSPFTKGCVFRCVLYACAYACEDTCVCIRFRAGNPCQVLLSLPSPSRHVRVSVGKEMARSAHL